MQDNIFYKCTNCQNSQYGTEFGECAECGYENLVIGNLHSTITTSVERGIEGRCIIQLLCIYESVNPENLKVEGYSVRREYYIYNDIYNEKDYQEAIEHVGSDDADMDEYVTFIYSDEELESFIASQPKLSN